MNRADCIDCERLSPMENHGFYCTHGQNCIEKIPQKRSVNDTDAVTRLIIMTPAKLKAAREACDLSLADWAYALGYRHTTRQAARNQAYEMETGRKAITPHVGRLAEMFRRHGVPQEWLEPRPET